MTFSTLSEPIDSSTVVELFRAQAKRVLTFLGFGELGYQETDRVLDIMRAELATRNPCTTLVNTGTLIRVGGLNGIADIYLLAKQMGFETTGIHPSVAIGHSQTHRVSPYVDHAFFVLDDTWGGFQEHEREPSPTLRTLLQVSDEVVVIGGGKHAADEMQAFWNKGTPLTYHPAEMNHAMSQLWSADAGVEISGFKGAAFHYWMTKKP